MANLTSSLTLTLKDLLSKPAGEAAAALKKFGMSAQDMQKSIKLDSFRQLQQSFAKARAEVAATQQKMKDLAAQFEKKPSNNLETALKRAADSAVKAKEAFAHQSAAIIESKNSLQSLGIPLSQVASEQARLRRGTLAATEALEQQGAKAQSVGARIKRGLGGMAAAALPVIGAAVGGLTYKALKAGAGVDAAETGMRAAGITAEEIKEITPLIMEQVAKFPGLGRAELMERYKEAIPYAKNPEEAKQLLPIIAQTMAALKLMGRPIEGMGFMIKAAQNVGMTKDPARFKGLMEAYVRYVNIKGPEFTPEMMASFFAGMKGSSAMLSDRFMHTIAMSLAAEMGSGKAGAGVDQLVKTAIAPTSEQAKEFVPLGLMNQSDFERPTAHGSFKSFGHVRAGAVGKLKSGAHVAGWQLAQTDPAEWIKRYFVPAMIQHGITDLESQLALVQKIYPGRSADVVTKLITQGEEYENEAKRAAKAAGTEETIKDYQSDATAQLDVLGTSLSNFGAVTKEIMPAAALAMDQISRSIASWSKSLSEWTEKHPTAAPWVVGSGIVAGLGASLAGTAYGAVKAIRFIKGLSGGVAAGEGAAASAAAPAGGLTAAGAKLLPAVSPTLLGAQQIIAAGTAGLNNPQLNAAIQHALPAYARGDQADSFGNGGGASGSWSNNTSAYRIPSPTGSPFDSRQAPIYIPPMIDTGSSDAHAAGARFAEAFREGVFGPLTGAVDDVLKARAAMLAALTFGASPSIKPTGGDIWTSGTTGINANGTFSDMGIAPLR